MLTTSRLVSFSIICPTHQQDYAMQQIETLGFDCPTNKQYDGRHSLKACSGSLDALGDKAFSCLVAFTARLHHTMKDSFGCFLPGSPWSATGCALWLSPLVQYLLPPATLDKNVGINPGLYVMVWSTEESIEKMSSHHVFITLMITLTTRQNRSF